jgi:secreted PhoX family phosphatase
MLARTAATSAVNGSVPHGEAATAYERVVLGAGAAATLAALPPAQAQPMAPRQGGPSSLGFPELRHQLAQTDAVAEGHEIQTLIRWGDPVLPGAPAFNAARVTPEAQALQFGYNNDYLDFFPLPQGSGNSDHGLLVVNHEYTNTNLMFPGMGSGRASSSRSTSEQTRAEAMAHGLSVVEVRRTNGVWGYAPASPRNRRITAETPMRISGPAAGAPRMRTAADPSGRSVLGTLNNCAGGNTPWGRGQTRRRARGRS